MGFVSGFVRALIIIYFTYAIFYDITEIELKYNYKDSPFIPSIFQVTVWNCVSWFFW